MSTCAMPARVIGLLLFLGLMFSASAQAQVWLAQATEAQAESGTAQPEGDASDGLNGRRFNDWTIRCQSNEAGEQIGCEAFQRLSVRQTGQRFLELAVGFTGEDKQAVAVFVLPLGIWLPEGLVIQIDDKQARQTPIQRCLQGGCLVQVPLEDDLFAELRNGKEMAVQIHRQPNDPMAVPVSLIGFTAALNAIK